MLTYECNGGRLGENISFIYGLFKFCKVNNIPYNNIIIDINYKNKPLTKLEKEEFVFWVFRKLFRQISCGFL